MVNGQLLVVDNASPYNDPNYLVQQILLSTGVSVSNVTFNGSSTIPTGANADMIGYFSGSSNIGIPTGVLLNTGNINDAPGPNDSGSDGIDNGTSGDPDLDQLAAGAMMGTYNAAILEFDFETVTDAISFRYVFASEEYNEYVCSSFNDVFGFFISGPGIAGPFTNNAINIAQVPSSSTYVGINTVNNGTIGFAGMPGGCGGPGDPGLLNTMYFVDNEALGAQSVQYDGFTTVLTAQTTLIPCETYHIKIAVSDANDGIYDSGVFLEEASFGAVGIQVQVGQVGAPIASVVEGCDSMIFTFSRPGSTALPLTIYFNVSGSATNGVDYDFFPDSVVIPAGQSSIEIIIEAFLDGIPEGLEVIDITIPANLTNNTCIDDVPSTAQVTIVNTDPLQLLASNDTLICPGDVVPLSASASGGIGPYTYSWSPATNLSCTNCPNPIATPNLPTTYTVTVTDDCGTDILTEEVEVLVGGLTVMPGANLVSVEGCSDATFTFSRLGPTTNSVTIYFTISGTATNGTDYSFIADSIVIPAGQSSVDLTIYPLQDGLLEPNESVTITTIPDTATSFCANPAPSISTLFIMNVDPIAVSVPPDTIICGGTSLSLVADGSGGLDPLLYSWDTNGTTIGANDTIMVTPTLPTTYTVTVSDTCGNTIATDQVLVTPTIPPPYVFSPSDLAYEGCKDAEFTISRADSNTSASLTVNYTIGGTAVNGSDYTTIPATAIIPAGQLSVNIGITATMDGITEGDEIITILLPRDANDSVCYSIPFIDTVTIKNIDPLVVSVSNQDICPGDSVNLLASTTGGIGDIQYSWSTGSNTDNTTVSPTQVTVYSINVSDTCGNITNKSDIIVSVRDVLGSVMSTGAIGYEGCKNTNFNFYLPVTLNSDYTIYYNISGSAQNGIDYETIPDSIVIPAGMQSVELGILPIYDGNSEGAENITIAIQPNTNDTLCPHIFTSSAQINDVNPLTVAAAGDTTVCNFDTYISALAAGGMGPLTYNWSNTAGIGNGVTVNPSLTTTYTISVVDSCGTSIVRDSVTIDVDCEYMLYFPNAFTPNDDGINDVFFAKGRGIKSFKMYIYNRWGDLIFYSEDIKEGWNGISNQGEKVSEQEVYVTVFETTDFLDENHFYVGKLILVQ